MGSPLVRGMQGEPHSVSHDRLRAPAASFHLDDGQNAADPTPITNQIAQGHCRHRPCRLQRADGPGRPLPREWASRHAAPVLQLAP